MPEISLLDPPSTANKLVDSPVLPNLRYDDLPDSWSFRILKINQINNVSTRCSLHVASLDDSLSYTALSYTWGSADPNDNMTAEKTKTLVCNNCTLPITENLWAALKTIDTNG